MQEVKQERTGWRDEALSNRHRKWGLDCPMVDIDFLAVEYDRGRVVAIVEYKHVEALLQYASHPSYRALVDLGDRAQIPVFAVRYQSPDFQLWTVTPLNRKAKEFFPETMGSFTEETSTPTRSKTMDEKEWVSFLYRIRGRKAPVAVLDGLSVGNTR